MRGRNGQPRDAEVGETLPEGRVVSGLALHDRPDARRRTLALEVAADRVLQEELVVGEAEIHVARAVRAYFRESRGSPRPRSAMMLRWMLAAPPAISTPSDHM